MARKPWTNDTIERIHREYYTTGPPSREVIPPGAQDEDGDIYPSGKKYFTEADLLRLAGQLDLAREQGWVPRWYFPCGDNSHKHRWRISAWLCKHLWRI